MHLFGSSSLVEQGLQPFLSGSLRKSNTVPPELGCEEGPAEKTSGFVLGGLLEPLQLEPLRMKHCLETWSVDAGMAVRSDYAVMNGEALPFNDRLFWFLWSRGHDDCIICRVDVVDVTMCGALLGWEGGVLLKITARFAQNNCPFCLRTQWAGHHEGRAFNARAMSYKAASAWIGLGFIEALGSVLRYEVYRVSGIGH